MLTPPGRWPMVMALVIIACELASAARQCNSLNLLAQRSWVSPPPVLCFQGANEWTVRRLPTRGWPLLSPRGRMLLTTRWWLPWSNVISRHHSCSKLAIFVWKWAIEFSHLKFSQFTMYLKVLCVISASVGTLNQNNNKICSLMTLRSRVGSVDRWG